MSLDERIEVTLHLLAGAMYVDNMYTYYIIQCSTLRVLFPNIVALVSCGSPAFETAFSQSVTFVYRCPMTLYITLLRMSPTMSKGKIFI